MSDNNYSQSQLLEGKGDGAYLQTNTYSQQEDFSISAFDENIPLAQKATYMLEAVHRQILPELIMATQNATVQEHYLPSGFFQEVFERLLADSTDFPLSERLPVKYGKSIAQVVAEGISSAHKEKTSIDNMTHALISIQTLRNEKLYTAFMKIVDQILTNELT